MKRKVRFHINILVWNLFLICSFETLIHGGENKDPTIIMKHRLRAKEAVIETLEVDGYVIDCIDINRQPAFKHPLLVNHTLQMKPTYYTEKVRTNNYIVEASRPVNLSKSCPEGSIPIRRVQRNDPSRDNSSVSHLYKDLQYFRRQRGMKDQKDDYKIHEHSAIIVHGGKYHGAKATINVWNPKVENKDEFSLSQIWVTSADRKISLEAGWMVYAGLYGDFKTRFFTFWTADGYTKAYCYNVRCSGFIQTNHHTTLDAILQPVSVYGGQQYAVDVEIFKEKTTGNWWLLLQGVEMGYWPKELVPSLAEGADLAMFGGEVVNFRSTGAHTTTWMGSGHFSYEGFKKSSFFKNIQVMDATHRMDPASSVMAIEKPRCYDLQVGGKKDGPWGCFFFYGGPGKSETCT